MKRMLQRFAVASALLSGVASAMAEPILGYTGTGFTQMGQPVTYGFVFTPAVDIVVDSLGFIDAGADGLAAAHRVGIWASDGSLLTSANVTTANSSLEGPTVNGAQFRYTEIADLELRAGASYTMGAAIEGGTDAWFSGIRQVSTSAFATISSNGFYVLSPFARPLLTISNTYAAGSFTARALRAVVPEPSSLALVGAVLVCAGAVTRRRSRATSTM